MPALLERKPLKKSTWVNPTSKEIVVHVYEDVTTLSNQTISDEEAYDAERRRGARHRQMVPNRTPLVFKPGEEVTFSDCRQYDQALWDVRLDGEKVSPTEWETVSSDAQIVGGLAPQLRRKGCDHLKAVECIVPAGTEHPKGKK